MQSEGRNARFLTCLFPHLSSPKPLSKSGQRGTGGGPEESSGRCQGDGGGGEWVWASVWVCMFWSWLPPQWKGAAMAVTCVRWGSEPVCTEHGPQAGAGSGGFSGSIMRRAIFWCDLSETFRVSLHWIGEVQRQGCGLPFEKKKDWLHRGEVESHICTLRIQCSLLFDFRRDCCLYSEAGVQKPFDISAFAGWKINQTMS